MQRRGFIVRVLGLFGLGRLCRGVEAAPVAEKPELCDERLGIDPNKALPWRTYTMEYKPVSPEERKEFEAKLWRLWEEHKKGCLICSREIEV